VGRVARAHGIKGWVAIRPFSENAERFRPNAEVEVGRDEHSTRMLRIDESSSHQDHVLVRFAGFEDRSQAEQLRGLDIFVGAEDLPELGQDEFWEHQIVGLVVLDTAGRRLGEITEVMSRGAQDLWRIETRAGSVLFPAAKQLVKSVDPQGGTAVVDPPAGLFEPQEDE
jgi:16S rRNA processing protein RimM